ncbi:MAG TPA: NAD(P)-binding domain-containing protein, partial [Polyangiaceae bacterium]
SGSTVLFGALVFGLVVAFARRRATLLQRRRSSVPLVRADAGTRRLPVIDAARCLGCNACVDACPYDVLEMSRYVAVVSRPEQCCGAGPCLVACPNGSLVLHEGPAPAEPRRLSARLESLERTGIFVAGDASGGSLIRSALEQGVLVADAVVQDLAQRPRARSNAEGSERSPVDLVVVGAGPAGLAAGLEAKARGLSVVVLEQASIAESIRRFSRDKLVLDAQPAGAARLPLWIGDTKKEELLRRWLRDVRAQGLDVREGARVVGVDATAGGAFRVRALGPDGVEFSTWGSRVVVATGRRGSPRKLSASVPDAALGRVHYELSDARAFAGSRAVVVGLGDVAMETALALSLQPGTSVTIVHRGNGFSRGHKRNIEALARRIAEGRIGLYFEAEVRAIGNERIVVETGGREHAVPYDVLFVHIGAEAASDSSFLASAPRGP